MVTELLNMTYEERLKEINFTTLKQKRVRGDVMLS